MADDLLSRIYSESLHELLVAVNNDLNPLSNIGIPGLDAAFLPSGLNFGDALQIHGGSASGKTQLLYSVLVACLVPSQGTLNLPGGWNRAAIVLDADGRFSIHRFRRILAQRIHVPEHDPVIHQCLKKLHIFRPTTSLQLAATIGNLQRYCATHGIEMNLGVVAIHSVDAFYWLDRFKNEYLQPSSARMTPMQHIAARLNELLHVLKPVVVVSNWGIVNQPPVLQAHNTGEFSTPRMFASTADAMAMNLSMLPFTHLISLTKHNNHFCGQVDRADRTETALFNFGIGDAGISSPIDYS